MKIMITGGTGLIGTEISRQLLAKGHKVVYYSRKPGNNALGIKEYGWDPEKGEIDESGLKDVDGVINLAGAPLDKRWTPQYKSTILRSRVDGTRLLFNTVQKHQFPVRVLVSASAKDYYHHDHQSSLTEDKPPGNDFLSTVCQKWEKEAQNFEELGIRTVRCRIGLVLSQKGGAFPQLALPVKFGVGAPVGSGRQWYPWIHVEDVAGVFIYALENQALSGPYNTIATNVTNEELTRQIARAMGRPFFMPKVPGFVLKLVFGEMAQTVLKGSKVSNEKLEQTGYSYKYPKLELALADLVK